MLVEASCALCKASDLCYSWILKMRLECEKQERLCPDLMWYGFCDKNEQRKCKRRHMFLEKDVQLNKDVPAHGQVWIIASLHFF